MRTDKHTITIEPVTIYPGGHSTTAVVERFNGGFVKICTTADRLLDGQSLIAEARGFAQLYGADFDSQAAVAEAVLES